MALVVDFRSVIELTDEQFEQICQKNRELRFERTAKGELVIMSPTGGDTGNYNANLTGQLWFWNQAQQQGREFDSSTGFNLPNGATRSPDVAWVSLERWQSLSPEQRRRFVPLCPDFAIELKSPSDELGELQAKMREYVENGLRLGWLIDPETKIVEIYRPDRPVEVLERPQSLSGEDVLPGFVLDLRAILKG